MPKQPRNPPVDPGLRCLHIVQCSNLGGMEHTAVGRMRGLKSQYGVTFSIASPRMPGKGWPMFTEFDVDARAFDYRGKYNLIGHRPFANHVSAVARTSDVVWVTGTCASSLRAARATGLPLVLGHHYHHGPGLFDRIKWRAFYELLGRDARHVVYVSEFIQKEAISIAPWLEGKTSVVKQAIALKYDSPARRESDKLQARRALNLPENAWIVGNAGWLIPRKRFDVFMEVAAKVAGSIPEALFVICGDGELRPHLEAHADRLGIRNKVIFAGWVSDLSEHYKAWDVLLFNTEAEAVGRTVLEAMSYGTPVVASGPYGGIKDLFSDTRRGDFTDEHDVSAMAQSILNLYSDRQLRENRSKIAAEFIGAEFSEAQSADGMIRALHKITA